MIPTAAMPPMSPTPLPADEIKEQLARYPQARVIWAQDEPANQGMWPYLALNLPTDLTGGVLPTLVSRPEAAAPAVGTAGFHRAQQEEILRQAFARH